MLEILNSVPSLFVRQKKEMAELFGFESRNKYSIETENGQQIAFAAEQGEGLSATLGRQFFGHWRKFEITIIDAHGQAIVKAHHPFRFYFQRLEVRGVENRLIGVIELKFSILSKKFEISDPMGNLVMLVQSPIWKIWTFPFIKNGQQVAIINKKWRGLLAESFLDADNFRIGYDSPSLTQDERLLILAASIFIDLVYFERKAGNR